MATRAVEPATRPTTVWSRRVRGFCGRASGRSSSARECRRAEPCRPDGEEAEDEQLQQREHSRLVDLAELRRTPPHLDLDRAGAGRTEDPDHAERREREQEDDRSGRRDGGADQREGDLPEDHQRRGAECRGSIFHVGGEVLPDRADGADRDGKVEHDVRAESPPTPFGRACRAAARGSPRPSRRSAARTPR